MRIGVPKEIKNHEYRVGLVPASVAELAHHGHRVTVEKGAGAGIGIVDADYVAAGATIADDAAAIWAETELIVKVKEPQAAERARLRTGQILFTYLHLAPDRPQTLDLLKSGATCVAYETVTSPQGGLPLLTPMSEVAGRLAPQVGAHALEKAQGGRGVLLGGVPGVAAAQVLVLGGGVSGTHAATIAIGMGAHVTVLDRSPEVLRRLEMQFGNRVQTLHSTRDALMRLLPRADLVIGAVLVAGAAAPKLVTRDMLTLMQPGSVLVDISIDQGGCFETSRPTTHCVANMPGAVARTSTFALNNATLPFALALADHGLDALRADPHLRAGLNVHAGHLTCEPVAQAHGLPYLAVEQALG